MAVLRHSTIALTMEIYSQVSSTSTRDALQRLRKRTKRLSLRTSPHPGLRQTASPICTNVPRWSPAAGTGERIAWTPTAQYAAAVIRRHHRPPPAPSDQMRYEVERLLLAHNPQLRGPTTQGQALLPISQFGGRLERL